MFMSKTDLGVALVTGASSGIGLRDLWMSTSDRQMVVLPQALVESASLPAA
jgi:short-subunit dehydrogenase